MASICLRTCFVTAIVIGFVNIPVASRVQDRSLFGNRAGPIFNLTDFGGIGDNFTLNTDAFVAAVKAVHAASGGTVVVPAGIFVTAPFNLTSHMTLYLASGATIRAPNAAQLGHGPAFPLWPVLPALPSYGQGRDHPGPRRTSLLHGEHLEDVVITSDPLHWGTIDGGGEPWWACHCGKTLDVPLLRTGLGLGRCHTAFQPPCSNETITRGSLIEIMYTSGLEISNLKLSNSPFWTIHPFNCQHVVIRNVDIWAPAQSPNTDGIDPDSCFDVLIENITYHGGDDLISLKSGWDCFGIAYARPTANIMIRNVTSVLSMGAGVAIGSEVSGGVRNVSVIDCNFDRARAGMYIKYGPTRGGYVRDIHFANIVLGEVSPYAALTISAAFGQANPSCPPAVPAHCPVENITFANITQTEHTTVSALIDFEGLQSDPIRGVSICGLHVVGGAVTCSLVSGTYEDAPKANQCNGLRPAHAPSHQRRRQTILVT